MRVREARELVALAQAAALPMEAKEVGWVLAELTKVSDVRFSERCDTACIVRRGGGYGIEFCPDFVRRELRDGRDVLFVLLHELHHKIRGDLFRDATRAAGQRGRELANVVEDIQINALLIDEYFPGGCGLLERLYDARSIPSVLLLPPDCVARELAGPLGEEGKLRSARNMGDVLDCDAGALRRFMKKVFERLGAKGRAATRLAAWYADAWLTDASMQGLMDRLAAILKVGASEITFLGDHWDVEVELPDFVDALDDPMYYRNVVAGAGGAMEEDAIAPQAPTREALALHREIARTLAPDARNPRDAVALAPERSVVPAPGRRECFLLARGVWPVFFTIQVPQAVKEESRVHVYIDVSASTDDAQPFLYGLFRHLGDLTGEPLYLFSNRVAEVTLRELGEGVRRSTRGTDFDCVVEHAVKNRFGKIVIVTDGRAPLSAHNGEHLRDGTVSLFLLLTKDDGWCPLVPLARKTWRLDV